VVEKLVQRWKRKLRKYDRLTQAKHDAAAAERANRAEDARCEEAAQIYADRLQLWGGELWRAGDIDRKLKGKLVCTGRDSQMELLQEQMNILTIGYGWGKELGKDHEMNLQCPKSIGQGKFCSICKDDGAHYVSHLKKHLKHVMQNQVKRWRLKNGKQRPEKPPPPHICVHKMPVLDEDAGGDPMVPYVRKVEARAQALVESGKVKAAIARLSEMTLPEMDAELVGRDIEITERVTDPKGQGKKRSQLYTYYATIQSIKSNDLKPKTKHRGCRQHIPMASAVVKYHYEGEPTGRVWLDPELYWDTSREGGWCMVDDGDDGMPGFAVEQTITEFHQKQVEHQMLDFSVAR